jgi:hypothetical protein
MTMKFRDSNSLLDIKSLIDNSTSARTILWQSINDNRVVYAIEDYQINDEDQIVQLMIKDYKDDIDVNKTIYIKLSYRETLFKAHVMSLVDNKLSLFVPKDVKTQELRSKPRIQFSAGDEKFVTISLENGLSKVKVQSLKFKVVDISESGISILVSDQNKTIFEKSQKVVLTHFGEFELPDPIFIEAKYSHHFRYRHRGKSVSSNKTGFAFHVLISPQYLDVFVNVF